MVGCGDVGGFPEMLGMMGGESMELPEGIPASRLPDPGSAGARAVERYCSQCHGIPSPRRHSPEDWQAVARRMFLRMEHIQHMGGMMGRATADVSAPGAAERREIVAYLREHAMRGVTEEGLPAGAGRDAFVRACSRCHGLPDPGQHGPDEWPEVVERMRVNMETMGVEEISDLDAREILRYLRTASGGEP